MTYDELRNFLIKNPSLAMDIIKGRFILSAGDNMSRLLSKTNEKGFRVTVEVDDDDLTEEQRKKRDADLADKAIRVLIGKI